MRIKLHACGAYRAFFALCLLFISAACTRDEVETPGLIRWALPERIDSVDSEYLAYMKGRYEVRAKDMDQIVSLDARDSWLPFNTTAELSNEAVSEQPPEFSVESNNDVMNALVGPKTGIACTVSVTENFPERIYIRCKGGFNRTDGVSAVVFQLTAPVTLPLDYTPGVLKGMINRDSRVSFVLTPLETGPLASKIIKISPHTRTLLFVYCNTGQQESRFDWIKISPVGEEYAKVLARDARKLAHPAVEPEPYIGSVLRPSLFLPPTTVIRLKPVDLVGPARFRCALGLGSALSRPVRITMTAQDEANNKHTVFEQDLTPETKGWIQVERDLSRLPEGTTRFELSCNWLDQPDKLPIVPPKVFCGSPIIYFEPPSSREPGWNLILFCIDTLRQDRLGCYGYDRNVSPNIDRFAAQNILCRSVYAHAPYTLPSHVSLFTSLYPSAHGVLQERDRISKHLELLAEKMARSGMATASFNNGGYVSHEFGFHRGFDLFSEVDPLGNMFMDGTPRSNNRYSDGSVGSMNHVFDWIHEVKDRPFYLFLHTFIVHCYLPPLETAEAFNQGLSSGINPNRNEAERYTQKIVKTHGITDEQRAYFENMYDATIHAADEAFGLLLKQLDKMDILDRTLIVVTSDHGEEFLEHGNIRHTTSVYDELIKIPLILKVPNMSGGVEIGSTLNQVDIMPTLLELMGMEIPSTAQGRSFVSLMSGRDAAGRVIYSEVDLKKRTKRACIIQDDWKYIEGDTEASLFYPAPAAEQLFNLAEDVNEQHDLQPRHPEMTERMKNRMHQLQKNLHKVREQYPEDGDDSFKISNKLREVLKQQGYL